ncbi:hypothetical protein E2C01_030133 [Portunus trituberculatus]|uniref:Uncharacterized protein n=1 Tax=Portunus trituberculatus TaxID=210409 RepID=A0A5B7EU40_PORTR|nr:hypothetical protein [Portunus trituberculatus]
MLRSVRKSVWSVAKSIREGWVCASAAALSTTVFPMTLTWEGITRTFLQKTNQLHRIYPEHVTTANCTFGAIEAVTHSLHNPNKPPRRRRRRRRRRRKVIT